MSLLIFIISLVFVIKFLFLTLECILEGKVAGAIFSILLTSLVGFISYVNLHSTFY